MLKTALAGLANIPQWFVWRLQWEPTEQKFKKTPVNLAGYPVDAQQPTAWSTFDTAQQHLLQHQTRLDGFQYTLGFMFTAGCGYWFLDIDGCVGADGQLTPWADHLRSLLPGAFTELSSSGRGLHFVGRNTCPPHRTRPTVEWAEANPGNDLEFYTSSRGMALGLTGQAWGSADTDHTLATHQIVSGIFPADVLDLSHTPGSGPVAHWRGPTDDNDLLRRAMKAPKSVSKMFGSQAGFADLWTCNIPVLAHTYPYTGDKAHSYAATEADFALAIYLAFWTGCDAERMERLMRQSALARPKWDEHRTYLRELTIARACAMQDTVCQDAEVAPVLNVATSTATMVTRMDYYGQIHAAVDDAALRNDVIPLIAADRSIEHLDRDFLAAAIKDRFKEWGFPVSIADCRNMLHLRAVEDQPDAAVPAWANRHVYLLAEDAFFDLETASVMSRVGFNAQYNRMMPQRPNGDREEAGKWCLERWNMATVAGAMYAPGRQPMFHHEGNWFANLYTPTSIPETATTYTPEGVAAINAFCKHLLCFMSNRVDQYTNMLDFLAFCVQNPGRKVRYMPVLKGVQGDGKTLLLEAMSAAMGGRNVGSVGPKLLTADFTDWAEGTLFTGFEEMMLTGANRYAVYNLLKEPLANSSLSINRKGKKSGPKVVNVTNYIGFTNKVDAVPLEDTDRRYWVIFSPYQSTAELANALGITDLGAHFDQIFDSFVNQRGEWRKFFLEYPVSAAFKPNGAAPVTAERAEMSHSGEDSADAIARQIIEAGGVGIGREIVSSAALSSQMRAICLAEGLDIPKTSALFHMLSRLGFSQIGPVWWEGKTHRVWWKRGDGSRSPKDMLDATKA